MQGYHSCAKYCADLLMRMHAWQLLIPLFILVDIDECKIGNKGGCHKDARCVNTVGSFQCQCKPGYEGDGKTCKGNDIKVMYLIVHALISKAARRVF